MKMICSFLLLVLALCLATFAGAQAGVTPLLVKADVSCNWKLDGQAQAPLAANHSTIVLVSPGNHVLEAAATAGKATLREELKVGTEEKSVAIQLKGRNDQQSKVLPAEPLRKVTAAEAAQNPTWTDPATGLMWTRKDNGSDVDWRQAVTYCSRLQYAGYNGWRLPTTEELEAIHDLSITTRQAFDNGMTYDVHVQGNLALTGAVWSGSAGQDQGEPYEASWEFTFAEPPNHSTASPNPVLNFTHFNYDVRALCVRRAR
jgi:hypothetical protein